MKFIIYGLVDPFTLELRYVGKSSRGLTRPQCHWKVSSQLERRDYCHNWIRGVIEKGAKPIIVVLSEVENPDNLAAEEIRIIKLFRDLKYPLTNLTAGGEGTLGLIKNPEIHKIIKCEFCQKEFKPLRKNAKFCQNSCAYTHRLKTIKYKERKRVKCLNDGNIFSSAMEASIYYKCRKSAINNVANGHRKKLRDLTFVYTQENINVEINITEEIIKENLKIIKNRGPWNKGTRKTAECKFCNKVFKMADSKKKYCSFKCYASTPQSEETKRKNSLAHQGKHPEKATQASILAHQKQIICLNDGKIYQSLKEAAECYKIHPSAISQQLNGKKLNCKGYNFSYK